jgi:hypothetical protein
MSENLMWNFFQKAVVDNKRINIGDEGDQG